jgi:hypothetical protein
MAFKNQIKPVISKLCVVKLSFLFARGILVPARIKKKEENIWLKKSSKKSENAEKSF